jgi:integrase
MTQDVRSMLTMLLAEEEQHRKDFGNQYLENQYVFKWPNGTPFDPDYVTHHFSDLLNKHGLPHIRFHELRHSCASIMIVSGFTLKDVQEWLGHSTIDVTADIYSHLDMDRKVKVGEKMTSVMC